MAKLGSSAVATVRQFAAQMDIDAYEAPDGAYSFDFERSGRLSILTSDEGRVIVSLTARVVLGDIRGYARLAVLGGYDQDRDQLIHCGLNRSDQAVLAVQCDSPDFSLPWLTESLTLLSGRLHELMT